MMTCPNCGYKQPGGEKCHRCSSLFSYYSQPETQREIPKETKAPAASVAPGRVADTQNTLVSTPTISAAEADRGDGFFVSWRTAYRVASGTSLALLVLVLVLIFHKTAPPQVPFDQQAAARAASKISQAETAAQQNQPHQITLNPTELNSYLNSNLQLAKSAAASDAAASPADSGPAAANPAPSSAVPSDASASPAEPTIDDVQSAVKDVKVDMVGDLVKAFVTFDFHGKDMSLELDGHLSSSDGYLRFEPVAGQLGSLPLPQSVLDAAVDKLMSSPENREKLRLPPGVSNIKIVDGQVVMN
jgi:hypothetical protein